MNVTVAKSLIPRVTETFVSTPLRESDIVDEPTASEIETTESKDENISGNSSNDLEAVSKEVPKIVQNGASTSRSQKETFLAVPCQHQVTFDFLSDKIAAAQNEDKPLDTLSVNVSVNEEGNHLSRKRSFMKRITTRRRAVRTSMNTTAHINRAAGYSKTSGKLGHVLSAEEKLRMYTLKEIVNTEEEYVQLLQFIVEVIIPKLNECAKDIEITCVSQDTVDKLLSNIEAIFKLHQKFFASLQEATYPYPYHTHCIGNVFLKHEKEFHVYEQYCANYKNAQTISFELEKDDKVKELVAEWKKEVQSKTRNFLHLEGFLISPVQRLCKYPLFLKELAKYTNESHNDFKSVAEAKQMMELVTTSVNEAERRKIIFEAIRDLEDANDLWEKNGAVSKQGFMTKRMPWWKGWNIYWFILDGYHVFHYSQPTDTKAAGSIELRFCKKLEEDATPYTGKPYSFGIEMPDRTHFMYCTNEQEKQDWLNIIKWKLSCLERSRRQTEKPIQTAIIASLSSMMNPTEPTTPCRESSVKRNEKNAISLRKTEKKRSKSLFRKSSRGNKTKINA